jgi:hypothetical protein
MQQSHFVKKYSVQFVNSRGAIRRRSTSGTTSRTMLADVAGGAQRIRPDDAENAREHGVHAHEGVRVHEVIFEDGRAVGVRIRAAERCDPTRAAQGRWSSTRAAERLLMNS